MFHLGLHKPEWISLLFGWVTEKQSRKILNFGLTQAFEGFIIDDDDILYCGP